MFFVCDINLYISTLNQNICLLNITTFLNIQSEHQVSFVKLVLLCQWINRYQMLTTSKSI